MAYYMLSGILKSYFQINKSYLKEICLWENSVQSEGHSVEPKGPIPTDMCSKLKHGRAMNRESKREIKHERH